MNIFTIPLRNLRRKALRTVILLLVFTIGILSMVAINNVSSVVGESLEKKLNQFGANILVYPKADTLKVSYGGFDLGSLSYDIKYLNETDVTTSIQNIELKKNIGAVAPKLVIVNRIMGQSVVIVGVNWKEEFKIKNYWIIDGRMPEMQNDILIGRRLAEFLDLEKNASVEIGAVSYKVAGVLEETGSDDDNVIFADISYLQSVSDKSDLVNFVEVSALCAGCPIEDIVAQISEKLPGTDIKALQNVVQQRISAVDFVKRLAGGVSLVIMLTASFMIALFMFTSVNERKKEIGVLRSMGYSRLNVFTIFCFEALLIGVIAGILGYFSGFFASFKVLDILEMGEDLVIRFEFTQFVMTFLVVVLVSVVSSIIPALKAARTDPSEALISL